MGLPAPMRVICVAFLAAAILLPEENGMAEAIIRRDDMPDSAYIVNRFDYPAIVAINNYFSNCKDGKDECVMNSNRKKKQEDIASCRNPAPDSSDTLLDSGFGLGESATKSR